MSDPITRLNAALEGRYRNNRDKNNEEICFFALRV